MAIKHNKGVWDLYKYTLKAHDKNFRSVSMLKWPFLALLKAFWEIARDNMGPKWLSKHPKPTSALVGDDIPTDGCMVAWIIGSPGPYPCHALMPGTSCIHKLPPFPPIFPHLSCIPPFFLWRTPPLMGNRVPGPCLDARDQLHIQLLLFSPISSHFPPFFHFLCFSFGTPSKLLPDISEHWNLNPVSAGTVVNAMGFAIMRSVTSIPLSPTTLQPLSPL